MSETGASSSQHSERGGMESSTEVPVEVPIHQSYMTVIEEKATRLLREDVISRDEYNVILSNHVSAMAKTTMPISPISSPSSTLQKSPHSVLDSVESANLSNRDR